jgi:hypothetical protein
MIWQYGNMVFNGDINGIKATQMGDMKMGIYPLVMPNS